jgi:hypothetical protein
VLRRPANYRSLGTTCAAFWDINSKFLAFTDDQTSCKTSMNHRPSSTKAQIRIVLLAGLLFSGTPGWDLLAQTNRATSSSYSHRCLFIFDTSRSMERRVDGAQQTVVNLLSSGLNGQLHPRDTLGVWTYNEDLYSGRFPLQEWGPDARKKVPSTVTSFLVSQKFEKQAHFAKVLPPLQRLATNSTLLTIILISSGEEELHGTPFDQQINATYAQWREQQAKNRMPFVTLLRVVKGKMTAYAATAAPWALDVPPLPPEARPGSVAQAKPAPPVQKPSASTPQALVFSGRKTGLAATNQPAEIAATKPYLASADTQAVVVAAANTSVSPSANLTPEQPKPASVQAFAAVVDQKQVQAGTEPSPTSTATPQQVASSAQISDPGKPAQPVAQSADPPKGSPTPTVAVQSPEQQQPSQAPPTNNTVLAADRSADATPAAQISVAGSQNWLLSIKGFLLLTAILLGMILWSLWLRKRREDGQRPISLITRSLDRQ